MTTRHLTLGLESKDPKGPAKRSVPNNILEGATPYMCTPT